MSIDEFTWISGWVTILGTVISLISLVITIAISVRTKNIKDEIISIAKIKSFRESKGSIIKRIDGMIKTLDKDDIMDRKFTYDLRVIVNQLSEYKEFIKLRHKIYIWQINKITNKRIDVQNKDKLVSLLSKLTGELQSINPLITSDLGVKGNG